MIPLCDAKSHYLFPLPEDYPFIAIMASASPAPNLLCRLVIPGILDRDLELFSPGLHYRLLGECGFAIE